MFSLCSIAYCINPPTICSLLNVIIGALSVTASIAADDGEACAGIEPISGPDDRRGIGATAAPAVGSRTAAAAAANSIAADTTNLDTEEPEEPVLRKGGLGTDEEVVGSDSGSDTSSGIVSRVDSITGVSISFSFCLIASLIPLIISLYLSITFLYPGIVYCNNSAPNNFTSQSFISV